MRTNHHDERLLAKNSESGRVTAKRTLAHRVTRRYAPTALLTSLVLFAGLFSIRPLSGQEPHPLSLADHIPLPNVKGRIDHFGVDVKGERLFVAAVENHSLEVVDLKSRQVVRTIADLGEPQGVYYDASTNHLFVACGLDGVTKIFDGTTFQTIATVRFPDDADNIRYDPRSKGVIVGYAGAKQLKKRGEGTGRLGFIDQNGKKIGDIVIDAHPESFQLEKSGSRIFVNVPDKKEIEVVDGIKRSVLVRWPVSEDDNFPMGLDETNHRLFVGVWKPAQLLVFDTETGRQITADDIAGKSDDLFYDPASRQVYVLTSKGFLEVFEQKDADHYNRVARYPTPPGSQTGLFVLDWGKLFVAVPAQGGQNAEVRVYRTH